MARRRDAHSIDEAIAFFEGLSHVVRHAAAQGIEEGAHRVLESTREIVGHYQTSHLGPYAPWEELADWTKTDRVASGYTENDPGLRDGTMRDSYRMSASGLHAQVGSNDMRAVWFEEGRGATPRGGPQPPRLVLTLAAWRDSRMVFQIIDGYVRAAISEAVRRG